MQIVRLSSIRSVQVSSPVTVARAFRVRPLIFVRWAGYEMKKYFIRTWLVCSFIHASFLILSISLYARWNLRWIPPFASDAERQVSNVLLKILMFPVFYFVPRKILAINLIWWFPYIANSLIWGFVVAYIFAFIKRHNVQEGGPADAGTGGPRR